MRSGACGIRVLLVDDHPAVREGLTLLLGTEGVEVCAEAARRADALACLEKAHPDVAIVDLCLDGEDGTELVTELNALGVPVLVFSMHRDPARVGAAFAGGALGYVSKRESPAVLVQGIREVSAGRRFLSPEVSLALAESLTGESSSGQLEKLSAQERQVFQLMGRGEGTAGIASALGISGHTVESYYARIQDKLGVSGMHELRRCAIAHLLKRHPV